MTFPKKAKAVGGKLAIEVELAKADGYEAGYMAGYAEGGKQMEQAKAGGILDLQKQLDAARAEITRLKLFREAVYNLLLQEMK